MSDHKAQAYNHYTRCAKPLNAATCVYRAPSGLPSRPAALQSVSPLANLHHWDSWVGSCKGESLRQAALAWDPPRESKYRDWDSKGDWGWEEGVNTAASQLSQFSKLHPDLSTEEQSFFNIGKAKENSGGRHPTLPPLQVSQNVFQNPKRLLWEHSLFRMI